MKKNQILIFVIVLVVLGAGYYLYNKQFVNGVAAKIVENDKDAHGCMVSVGYVFSVIRNGCIKLSESAIKLDPKDDSVDQNSPAYVIFKSQTEYQIAELFLPGKTEALDLAYAGGSWSDQDAKYTLMEAGKSLLLLNQGRVLLYAYDQK